MRIFSDDLPAPILDSLMARMVPRRYGRGETIVYQGDPSENLFLIESGHVCVKIGTPDGLSVTVGVLGPDESFGEMAALAHGGTRTASVVALDDVACRVLSAHDFNKLRAENREIDRHLVEVLARRLLDLDDRLSQNLHETVQRRCVRRLIEVAALFAEPGTDSAILPLTQEDLAAMSGATRPTTNQALAALSKQGLISLGRGHITVVSIAAMRAFAR